MKTLIVSIAAAGVLVAGAFIASSVTTSPVEAQTPDTTTQQPDRPDRGEVFDEVIAELVAEGTIDTAQAEAIKEAFQAKHDELVAEFGENRRGHHPFRRGALKGLLADDVITEDEIAGLPDDHPLKTGESPLAELLEDDGQITADELETFKEENGWHHGERSEEEGLTS